MSKTRGCGVQHSALQLGRRHVAPVFLDTMFRPYHDRSLPALVGATDDHFPL
jgi:hypothetical protein